MKLHKNCLTEMALREISEREGISTDEVESEIMAAVSAAMKAKSDVWDGILKDTEELSAKTVILGIAERVKSRL